jgi:hypothetical protein
MRLALAHATWACHDVAQFVYTSSGTVALRSGVIQRLFRDMHAGTQHVTSALPVIRNTGRELAGLALEVVDVLISWTNARLRPDHAATNELPLDRPPPFLDLHSAAASRR